MPPIKVKRKSRQVAARPAVVAPEELKKLRHWVYYKEETRPSGSVGKVPYSPLTGRLASTDKPSSWVTFEEACRFRQAGFDGVSFAITPELGIVGVDFDDCLDPETGALKEWARPYVDRLPGFKQKSASGCGLHCFVRATKPGKRTKRSIEDGAIEIFDLHFLSFTDDLYGDGPHTLQDGQEAINSIYADVFGTDTGNHESSLSFPQRDVDPLDDATLLDRARHAANGAKITLLYDEGDTSGYGSDSEADLALASGLAFWAGPNGHAQVERLLMGSALVRDKWDNHPTYLKRTISKAYERRTAYASETLRLMGDTALTALIAPDNGPVNDGDTALTALIARPNTEKNSIATWPESLHEDAYHGLLGQIVRTLEPHTESDPNAILVQTLIAFGNLIGRHAHTTVEADRHFCNMFGVLVGETSRGRKGTSWGYVRKLMGFADATWSEKNVVGGMSSGEGLIWAVRDPIEETRAHRDRRTREVTYETEITDQGVFDKRLLVTESEFASVLKMVSRDGNVLSAIIRDAWDKGNLRTMTKNSPAQATGAHISIIGHITAEELRRNLTATETANGFANRFLWVCVRRSKSLPEGGSLAEMAVARLGRELSEAVRYAATERCLSRDDAARELWAEAYGRLTSDRYGLFGCATSRAEAQVLRLSMLYALLDKTDTITVEHLRAALAVWRYCQDSAAYLFGNRLGDPEAEKALTAIRQAADGLTRDELRNNVFKRHMLAEKLDAVLERLLERGLVAKSMQQTHGRPCERWKAARRT